MKKNAQFFALAILLATSSFASAQAMIRQSTVSPGMLLNRKDVQDDLKLSTEVRNKIKVIWEKALEESGAESQGNGSFIIRTGGAHGNPADKMTEKAVPLLSAAQKGRLEEIRIQLVGPRIVIDPAVKPKMGLTADQDSKIKKLLADEQATLSDLIQESGGRIDQSLSGKMKEIRKKTDTGIDKVMSKTQKDKLKELGGAPFKAQM